MWTEFPAQYTNKPMGIIWSQQVTQIKSFGHKKYENFLNLREILDVEKYF
jgi:hypothetical protein